MDWNKFDRIILRFNHIVLALIFGLGALVVIGSIAIGLLFRASNQQQEPKTDSERAERNYEASLSEFQSISGTELLVARLASESDIYSNYSFGSISPSGGSYSGAFTNGEYAARNYLFLDGRSGESHWLAPNNDSIYLAEHALHEDPNVSSGKLKTLGFVYMIMPRKKDSKQTNTVNDPKTLTYYKLSDGKLKTLATNVKQLFGVQEVLKQQALLLFKDENKNYVMSINTETGDQIYKKELPGVMLSEPRLKGSSL
jgi:hypothetical protein